MILSLGITPKNFAPLGTSYDADAQAFITAAGITDTTQKSAVNQLVLDLKSYSIWDKMKAIYPIIGGTATTHKWNLKDPRDLDAAFRLNFSTGWTHASTGMTPSNAYANTFLNPTSILTSSNNHASTYNRTNTSGAYTDIGSYSGTTTIYYMAFRTRQANNTFLLANGNTTFPSIANSDSKGFYLMCKNSSNTSSGYKNGTKVINSSSSGTGVSNQNIYIGSMNANGTAAEYSNREIAFSSIGNNLTDTEASNLYTTIQAYQTTLSRNV